MASFEREPYGRPSAGIVHTMSALATLGGTRTCGPPVNTGAKKILRKDLFELFFTNRRFDTKDEFAEASARGAMP